MPDGHDHTHGHTHGDVAEWASRAAELVSGAETFLPMVDQALAWVLGKVPDALTVLDVGSGPGVAACRMAELLPAATVLAVDGAPTLLEAARQRASRLGVGDRFNTREVRLPDDLEILPSADLIWISGVLHHLPDAVEALQSLGNLLNPGGLLAISEGGLPMRFLPDGLYPGLLSRIDAAGEEAIAAQRDRFGVYVHQGTWPTLIAAAGLTSAGSRSFLLDVPAPIPPALRADLRARVTMLRERIGPELSAEDQSALTALVEGDVLDRPDIFVLTAGTVHLAAV